MAKNTKSEPQRIHVQRTHLYPAVFTGDALTWDFSNDMLIIYDGDKALATFARDAWLSVERIA